jgi:D-alanine-D-alanine ligase
VPALLEMSGIAYTGPTPRGHAILLDRVANKALLQQADVLTPAYRTLGGSSGGSKVADGMLPYPLIVKPRYESTYRLRAVHDRRELKDSIRSVARRSGPDVIVEQFLTGKEIHACLLGNDPVECLPLVERDRQTGEKICPARIDDILAARIRDIALTAYGVSGCRDYARIDFIVCETGQAYVIEVLVHSILGAGGSFATAAQYAGYPFAKLPSRIVAVARARHAPHRRIRPLKAKRSAEIGAGEEALQ